MLVLVDKHTTTLEPWIKRYPNVGRLITPRNCGMPKETPALCSWAADNDCFNGGLDEDAWLAMLDVWAGRPNCLFATAPDVVGDAEATLQRYDRWQPLMASMGYPVALVTQDGLRPDDVPWPRVDVLFIGGTDEHKLGPEVRTLVRAAKSINPEMWIHMGRVNTRTRTAYACSLGVDSIDGTSVSRYTKTYLPVRATDALCRQARMPISDEELDLT